MWCGRRRLSNERIQLLREEDGTAAGVVGVGAGRGGGGGGGQTSRHSRPFW